MSPKTRVEISVEPKIPLRNYLLELVEEGDDVGNSLYLYNVENFIKEMWKEIMHKKKKINVRKVFPKELKLEPTHFYSIIKGKRGISIQSMYKFLDLWKVYCNKKENNVNQKWDEIYNSDFLLASFSKAQKLNMPKHITPKCPI